MRRVSKTAGLFVAGLFSVYCGSTTAAQIPSRPGAKEGAIKTAYPTKPVRVIISTSASGGTDFAARIFGQKLSELWGQSVVMDNRPGATGMIGMEAVAHGNPDGYTLLIMNVGHLITAALSENLNFDVGKDLLPLSVIASTPVMMVVHPAVKARNTQELIALAKAQPGKLAYASGGTGGVQHLSTELFKREAKVDLLHVPYKGTGPGVIDLIAGHVQLTMTSVPSVLPHVNSGKLRAMAVTGAARLSAAPDVPTFREIGLPGVSVEIWYGLLAPSRTPRDIVNRIAQSVAEVAKMNDVKDRMVRGGAEPVGSSPADFSTYFKSERDKWVKVARQANIKLESSR
jgi:tripartite-type tricarboxylate transporter receptor subunit TctC